MIFVQRAQYIYRDNAAPYIFKSNNDNRLYKSRITQGHFGHAGDFDSRCDLTFIDSITSPFHALTMMNRPRWQKDTESRAKQGEGAAETVSAPGSLSLCAVATPRTRLNARRRVTDKGSAPALTASVCRRRRRTLTLSVSAPRSMSRSAAVTRRTRINAWLTVLDKAPALTAGV